MREIKGEVSSREVIAATVALLILSLMVFGSVTNFDWLQRLFSLGIPDYNRSVDVNPGMAIVGIKLSHLENPATEGTPKAISYFISGQRNLSYYTGSEWVEVKQSDLTIETKQFNAVAMRNALAEFYFNTPRIGSGVFALPNYRQLSPYVPTCCGLFEQNGNVLFNDKMQPGYAGAPLTDAYLGFDNKFYENERYKKEIQDYDSLKSQIVLWRDQILQGEPCQKTISLSYNDKGSPVTRTYFVQKIPREDGMYVYVDLNAEASSAELYSGSCFSSPKLAAGNFKGWFRIMAEDKPAWLSSRKDSIIYSLVWDSSVKEWRIGASGISGNLVSLNKDRESPFFYQRPDLFYESLSFIVSKLSKYYSVVVEVTPSGEATQTVYRPADGRINTHEEEGGVMRATLSTYNKEAERNAA